MMIFKKAHDARHKVAQLRAQLEALKFNVAEYKSQLDGVSRELVEARVELARRNAVAVLASSPSPSAMKH